MKNIKDNKGSTLLVVLVLSGVALVIAAGLIYMVTESTRMSGSSKRYKTALEAARACVDVTVQYIDSRPTFTTDFTHSYINFTVVNKGRLVDSTTGKLYAASTGWPSSSSQSISIDTADSDTYDVTTSFTSSPYTCYVKISGTRFGNSGRGGSSRLHGGGTTDTKTSGGGGTGSISVVSYPWLYAIEILSVSTTNEQERARISVLYQY